MDNLKRIAILLSQLRLDAYRNSLELEYKEDQGEDIDIDIEQAEIVGEVAAYDSVIRIIAGIQAGLSNEQILSNKFVEPKDSGYNPTNFHYAFGYAVITNIQSFNLEELQNQLKEALQKEDYETAAIIRDEIDLKRQGL